MENFAQLNWLAIGVGTIAAFAFGMFWYSPKIMGIKWAIGKGVDIDAANQNPPLLPLLAQFIALFLMALVIGFMASINALITAILAILAAATFVAASGGFVRNSYIASTIDFIHIFLCGVIMIIAQGIF